MDEKKSFDFGFRVEGITRKQAQELFDRIVATALWAEHTTIGGGYHEVTEEAEGGEDVSAS